MLNDCPDPGSGLASLLIGINTLLILEDNGTLLRHEMIEIVDQSLSNLKSSRLGSGLSEETALFAHAFLGQLRERLSRDERRKNVDCLNY
jgi:hypothetical protein